MVIHYAMLIAWLVLLCGALGSTIPGGAVLLERTSHLRPFYDYVIVGGGTSGLVVANRLTEDPESMFFFWIITCCGGQTGVDSDAF